MALTTAGAQILAKAITNLNSPTLFNSSNFSIGVGDSTTAFAIGQTDLQAASNKFRKLVSSLSESSGVVTAVASYSTSEANFAWEEWSTHNTGNTQTGGTMLTRKVESLGTKTSAQTWQFTVTLTFAAS